MTTFENRTWYIFLGNEDREDCRNLALSWFLDGFDVLKPRGFWYYCLWFRVVLWYYLCFSISRLRNQVSLPWPLIYSIWTLSNMSFVAFYYRSCGDVFLHSKSSINIDLTAFKKIFYFSTDKLESDKVGCQEVLMSTINAWRKNRFQKAKIITKDQSK